MNSKLASGGVLCAALLTGCSSSPQLTLPDGKWEELNTPSQNRQPIMMSSAPANLATATPAVAVSSQAPGRPTDVASAAKPTAPVAPTPKPAGQLNTGPENALKVATKPAEVTGVPSAAKTPLTAPEKPSTAPSKSFPSTPAAPVVTVVAPQSQAIKPPPVPKPVWDARPGETLRSVITRWSSKAGYHADWQPQGLDYPIEAPLRFEGSFEDSVISIFRLYDNAERPFCVDGRRGQKRLNISENLNPATQCQRP